MRISKIQRAKDFIIHELVLNKVVSLDYLSKEISNNIGSLNLYEPISQLRRRDNYIIGLSGDYKSYMIMQRLDGSYLFEEGYADSVAHTNNKMSSREAWRLFKHDDYYYFDNQPKYKDIALKLLEVIDYKYLNEEEPLTYKDYKEMN